MQNQEALKPGAVEDLLDLHQLLVSSKLEHQPQLRVRHVFRHQKYTINIIQSTLQQSTNSFAPNTFRRCRGSGRSCRAGKKKRPKGGMDPANSTGTRSGRDRGTAVRRCPALEQRVWVKRRVGKQASEKRVVSVVRNGRGFGGTMADIARGNDPRSPA